MSDEILLRLPPPPSSNRYWRKGRVMRGRRLVDGIMMISEQGRTYRDRVIAETMAAGVFKRAIHGPISVGMVLYWPDRRRRDQDNFRKALWDALTHAGVWLDDSQVRHDECWTADEFVPGGVAVVQIRRLTENPIPAWGKLGGRDI